MAFNYEAVTSGANPTADSLLIPYGDLDGLTDASELGNSTAEDDAKISAALFFSMQSAISGLTDPLGIAQTKPNPIGTATDTTNQTISFTWSYVADLVNRTASIYPASGGSSKTILFTDIFPTAEIVETTGTATADSLAIPLSDLASYDVANTVANLQGNLGSDQRALLESLTRLTYDAVVVRATGVQSGITAKTKGNATGLAQPANFFTDTTFVEADAPNLAWFSVGYSITFQFLLNHETGQFDVNVA